MSWAYEYALPSFAAWMHRSRLLRSNDGSHAGSDLYHMKAICRQKLDAYKEAPLHFGSYRYDGCLCATSASANLKSLSPVQNAWNGNGQWRLCPLQVCFMPVYEFPVARGFAEHVWPLLRLEMPGRERGGRLSLEKNVVISKSR